MFQALVFFSIAALIKYTDFQLGLELTVLFGDLHMQLSGVAGLFSSTQIRILMAFHRHLFGLARILEHRVDIYYFLWPSQPGAAPHLKQLIIINLKQQPAKECKRYQ